MGHEQQSESSGGTVIVVILVLLLLMLGGFVAVAGIWLFQRRELATAQGNQ